MLYSGTDPESYITEYTRVYEDKGYGCKTCPGFDTDNPWAHSQLLGGVNFWVAVLFWPMLWRVCS